MDNKFFNRMVSNTLAGSSNQHYFETENSEKEYTSRVFYKVFSGGTYNYSFLFSSILDGTFWGANRNEKILGWEIIRARVGISRTCSMEKMPDIEQMQALYFNGTEGKKVDKAELFACDEIALSAKKNEYICLEVTYKGKRVPRHNENWIAAFLEENGKWAPSNQAVFANMVGCDRKVKKKIAFLGDSITQGIGVEKNSYKNWCALLAEKLGQEHAYWNLGIGMATANDAATDGVWLYKAKQNDIVFVCFGVNDIFKIQNEEKTKKDLYTIIKKLKETERKVIIQTIPPFNYDEEKLLIWKNLNKYIQNELSQCADLVFDCVPLLEYETKEGKAKYNGHPNEIGCALWANELYGAVKNIIKQ